MKRLSILFGIAVCSYGQANQAVMVAMGTPVPSVFLHSRSLTIDHTLVGSTDLTNYTVYVSLTLGASRIQNASCYDVVFATDSGNVTPLSWEPTTPCDASTGAFAAHIKIPTVSHTSDTVFYVIYDNASISSFQSTGSAWDSSYVAMWHLSDGITLSGAESTTNGYTLNCSNGNGTTATTGQVDGAAHFSGNGWCNNASFPWADNSPVTASFWAYKATADAGTPTRPWGPVNRTGAFFIQFFSDSFLYWDYGNTGGSDYRASVSYAGHFDAWTYVTLTSGGGTGGMVIYLNGSSAATNATSSAPTGVSGGMEVGEGPVRWIGDLDELSFSNVVRPAGWASANYHATKTSPDLVAVGTEI